MAYSNSEVAHIWANQLKDSATGSNLFFVGKIIYSYGPHYVSGVLIPEKRTALINKTKYSTTTSRHTSLIVEATKEYKQIFAYYPNDPYKNTERVIRECSTLLGKYDRARTARKKSKVVDEINSVLFDLKKYNDTVGYEPTELQAKTIERLTEFVNSDTPA